MPRVGIKGYLGAFAHYADAVPTLDWITAQIENALAGQLDATNIATGGVGTTQIADASVTASKLAAGSVTQTSLADGVGFTASGVVTGDGTANRVVSVGFTPRWVQVIRTDGTFVEYVSMSIGASAYNWYRDSNGLQGAATTSWQGIVAGGFKFGSGPGTSNAVGVVYAWVAWK